MDELFESLRKNNIAPFFETEKAEFEYYNITVYKRRSIYIIEPNHPLLENIDMKFNIVEGKIVLTTFQYLQLKELVQLEQGNLILKEI